MGAVACVDCGSPRSTSGREATASPSRCTATDASRGQLRLVGQGAGVRGGARSRNRSSSASRSCPASRPRCRWTDENRAGRPERGAVHAGWRRTALVGIDDLRQPPHRARDGADQAAFAGAQFLGDRAELPAILAARSRPLRHGDFHQVPGVDGGARQPCRVPAAHAAGPLRHVSRRAPAAPARAAGFRCAAMGSAAAAASSTAPRCRTSSGSSSRCAPTRASRTTSRRSSSPFRGHSRGRSSMRWTGSDLRKASVRRYFAISNTVAQREGYFPPGAAVEVLPHPSDLEGFRQEPGEFVFTASRLDGPKRLDLLIKAYRKCRTDAPLVIAGDGPAGDALRAAGGRRSAHSLRRTPDRRRAGVALRPCAFRRVRPVPGGHGSHHAGGDEVGQAGAYGRRRGRGHRIRARWRQRPGGRRPMPSRSPPPSMP